MESEHYTLETRDSDFGYHGWCPSNLNFEESIFPVYLYTSPWRSNTFRSHARSALSCLHLFEKLGGHQRNEQNDVFPSSQFWEQNAAPPIEDSKILKKHVSWGNHKDNMIMILSYKFIRCSIGIGKNHRRFESLIRRRGGGSWDFYSQVADTSCRLPLQHTP